jgi:hypothetical protein
MKGMVPMRGRESNKSPNMLKRRQFGKAVAGGVIGAGLPAGVLDLTAAAQKAPVPRKNLLMHVGGDYHSVAGGRGAGMTERANLEYNLRFGVKSLTVQMERVGEDGSWELDELQKMRDNCEKAGVTLEAVRMDSGYISCADPGCEFRGMSEQSSFELK